MIISDVDIIFLSLLVVIVLILATSNTSTGIMSSTNGYVSSAKYNIVNTTSQLYEYLMYNRVSDRIRLTFDKRYQLLINDRRLMEELNELELGTDDYKKSNCYKKARYKVAERFAYDITYDIFNESSRDLQILHSVRYSSVDNYDNSIGKGCESKYMNDYNNGLYLLSVYDQAINTKISKHVLSLIKKNKTDDVRKELFDLYSNGKKQYMSKDQNNDTKNYGLCYSALSGFVNPKTNNSGRSNFVLTKRHLVLTLAIEMKLLHEYYLINNNKMNHENINNIIKYAYKFGMLFDLVEDFTRYYEDIYYKRPNAVADFNVDLAYEYANAIYIDVITSDYYKKLNIKVHTEMMLATLDSCYKFIKVN